MWSLNRTCPVQSPDMCLFTSLQSVSLRVYVWVWKEQKKPKISWKQNKFSLCVRALASEVGLELEIKVMKTFYVRT